ncbi:hypothetical protein ABW19_dt0200109 [Dactylella cylindrospora]|nr:hypothetical protein ABW19_dt0200109 [Dactylella cylindrospora]
MQHPSDSNPAGRAADNMPGNSPAYQHPHTPQQYYRPLHPYTPNDWRNRSLSTTNNNFTPQSGNHGFQRGPSGGRYQMNEFHAGATSDPAYVRQTFRAAEEGRRLYLGNIDYDARAADIALWLEGAGFEIKVVDIPARDENNRRPIYGFVEFYTKDDAEKVLQVCNGRKMMGRPIRVDYCRRGTRSASNNHSVNHGSGQPNNQAENQTTQESPTKPSKAFSESDLDVSKLTINDGRPASVDKSYLSQEQHHQGQPQENTQNDQDQQPRSQYPQGRQHRSSGVPPSSRLFVGGLPYIENINQLEDLIAELFRGFHIESMSSIHTSKDPKAKEHGNTSYCFVDLSSIGEAKMAIQVLNNRDTSWGTARVNFATGGTTPARNKYRSGGTQGPENTIEVEEGNQGQDQQQQG